MVGLATSTLRPNCGRKSGGGTVRDLSAISLRSPPAQKARSPAPVSTSTFAVSSALNRRTPANRPSRTAWLSALRASGRSIVSQPTPRTTSYRTGSLTRLLLLDAPRQDLSNRRRNAYSDHNSEHQFTCGLRALVDLRTIIVREDVSADGGRLRRDKPSPSPRQPPLGPHQRRRPAGADDVELPGQGRHHRPGRRLRRRGVPAAQLPAGRPDRQPDRPRAAGPGPGAQRCCPALLREFGRGIPGQDRRRQARGWSAPINSMMAPTCCPP